MTNIIFERGVQVSCDCGDYCAWCHPEMCGYSVLDAIRPGDRVTIENPQKQERSGRAVMRGPAGWVLNMGGRYGTPGIATESNIVSISRRR
jgi:hypothetical protein